MADTGSVMEVTDKRVLLRGQRTSCPCHDLDDPYQIHQDFFSCPGFSRKLPVISPVKDRVVGIPRMELTERGFH